MFLKAYYDESISHPKANPNLMVLGGCAMIHDDWLRLERDWLDVLRDFGIRIYRSADCNASKGDFTGWDGERKDRLRARLIEVIRNNCGYLKSTRYPVLFSYILDIDIFNRLAAEYPHIDIAAYEFCVLFAVRAQAHAASNLEKTSTLGLFFEKGQNVRPHIRRIMREERQSEFRVIDISFISKKDNMPLQVADMFAWETNKSQREGLRKPLLDLARTGNLLQSKFDEISLRKIFSNDLRNLADK